MPLPAQVLARPGWAGSGVAPEAWWRRAVFYRIDPARFQDSNQDGIGDLAGITARLDYLQSLGVDALVLDRRSDAVNAQNSDTLDDLIRAASGRHLRLLMTVTPAMQQGDRARLVNAVHAWLSAGVAGIWVPKPLPETAGGNAAYGSLLGALTGVLRSLPGERVLLAEPAPLGMDVPADRVRAGRRSNRSLLGAAQVGRLIVGAALPVQLPQVAALRQGLQGVAADSSPTGNPLLRFAEDPATGSPDVGVDAALLLASRGASMFEFGDEIGLDTYPATAGNSSQTAPVMQWTPVNIQQTPIERPAARVVVTPPGGITPFGAYHAYVRPSRRPGGSGMAGPNAPAEANAAAPLPDPNTLPGFTKGPLPVEPVQGARINVVTEDRDPNSLLNAYRELIALHHDNPTLRNGTQYVLNRDAQEALVWVRRAPAGSRTAADVVVAANLGDKPVTLSLEDDLQQIGVRGGVLRALFSWSPQVLTGETTGALMLPPHAVFIGEVYRSGAGSSMRSHRGGRTE